jgi:transposase
VTPLVVEEPLFEVAEDECAPVPVKAPAGAAKTFRRYDRGQSFLLPPSLDDWLAEDHEARVVAEVVDELLDLSSIYASYVEASGAPPYDPRLMVKLLIYGYSTGVTSAREIERRCHLDVAFRWLVANATPDYRSISRFRRRHLGALSDLFVQVLSLCAGAGLVTLGRVALDGTKLRASASRHKAMSYERMGPKIDQLQSEVDALLAQAEADDRADDVAFGEDRRGDELPKELARRESRLKKLREAKAAIEKEANDKAAQVAAERARAKGNDDEEVAKIAEAAAERAIPAPKAQRNFTDPESRMMKTSDGFHYAYNAQATVDEASQVILAAELSNRGGDVDRLIPTTQVTEANLAAAGVNERPRTYLADAGYCSEDNLSAAHEAGLDVLIATGRAYPGERVLSVRGPIPVAATKRQRMARRLKTTKGRTDYARRKAIVEPAFGQMKVRQRAGFIRLRGLEGAQGEWTLHAMCHNLRKLAAAIDLAAVPA